MTLGVLLLGTSLVSATPVTAGPKTDILYMTNGDRLTCEIKSLSAGSLQVSLDYVDGTIAVNWSNVARMESTKLFIIRVRDGGAYTGTVSVARSAEDSAPSIVVTEAVGDSVTLGKREIVHVTQTSDNFWRRFYVDISSGFIYTKGNQTTQYNIGSTIQYTRERWGAQLSANSSLSSSSGSTASTREQLGLAGLHLAHWRNWFYSGSGTLLQSSEQSISLQTTLSGGMGRYLANTGTVTWTLAGGLAWQNTQYDQSLSAQTPEDILAVTLGMGLKVVTFKKTNLVFSTNLLPALSEPGRIFLNANATYYLKIFGDLTLNLSAYGNFDSRPPENLSGSDYGFSSGLGWSFGTQY